MAFITAVNMANSRRLAVVLTAKQQLWQNSGVEKSLKESR